MKFEDVYFSKEDRYSIGTETDSGRHYVSMPVSNGLVDYEEYYEIDAEQYKLFWPTRLPQSRSSKHAESTNMTIG